MYTHLYMLGFGVNSLSSETWEFGFPPALPDLVWDWVHVQHCCIWNHIIVVLICILLSHFDSLIRYSPWHLLCLPVYQMSRRGLRRGGGCSQGWGLTPQWNRRPLAFLFPTGSCTHVLGETWDPTGWKNSAGGPRPPSGLAARYSWTGLQQVPMLPFLGSQLKSARNKGPRSRCSCICS